MKRILAVAVAALALVAPATAQAASFSDGVKDRRAGLTVPLPTRQHVDGGPAVLHSVTFPAEQGQKFLVTMNIPGIHPTDKLSNAARLQCQSAGLRVNAEVPLEQKTHYNERIYRGYRQTGDEALWQMLFTAPAKGAFTCRVLVKPYGYWYDIFASPERIPRKALFLYTAGTYLQVEPVRSSSLGARAEREIALGSWATTPRVATTPTFTVDPASSDPVRLIGLVKATQCERNAYDPSHVCSQWAGREGETTFRVRAVLTQYSAAGAVCRTLTATSPKVTVGSESYGKRGHENVRVELTVPGPLTAEGCANRFAAHTEVQRISGGGLWVERSSTSTIVLV